MSTPMPTPEQTTYLQELLSKLGAFGFNLLIAAGILLVGRWAVTRVANLVATMLTRAKVDDTLTSFLRRLTEIALLLFVGIAALSQLGIETTSFIAVLGAAGLAVGLALQGTLGNFAAGVMLILFRPFKIGDVVQVAGQKGKVKGIQIFNTHLMAPDNAKLIIPNGQIIASVMINYTAMGTRRVDLTIGVSYEDDLKLAREVISRVVHSHGKVLSDPAPVIAVNELADSSVNFVVRPWARTADYWEVYWDLTEQLKIALDEAGITIPFPQRQLHVIEKK